MLWEGCPKIPDAGEAFGELGKGLPEFWGTRGRFWGGEEAAGPQGVQELDRATSPKLSSSFPRHPAVATKALISLFLKEIIN